MFRGDGLQLESTTYLFLTEVLQKKSQLVQ